MFKNLKEAHRKVASIQEAISILGFSEELFLKEIKAHKNLDSSLVELSSVLCQKCRANWFKDGDRSTLFFHSLVKIRKATKSITIMKIRDNFFENDDIIKDHWYVVGVHQI